MMDRLKKKEKQGHAAMASPVSAVTANVYEALVSAPCTFKIWSMWTTSLVSPYLERLSVFFPLKG